ncbi:MAG: hypothetical protein FWC22_03565 [Treponema sp.]|nr:hypothetical protein [Treponema sp.]
MKEERPDYRKIIYNNTFSAGVLFIAGLLIMPAVLFNPSTGYRVAQFLFFWFLAILSGKRVDFIFTILITLFIIAFNLIIPYGKILFSAGIFKVTSGALEAGIHRAVSLQALVMLSKFTVRHDLKLPGAFGNLLGESLRIFSVITSRKYRITGKNLFAEIDAMMLEISSEELPEISNHIIKTKPIGYITLIVIILLSWLPWIFIFY